MFNTSLLEVRFGHQSDSSLLDFSSFVLLPSYCAYYMFFQMTKRLANGMCLSRHHKMSVPVVVGQVPSLDVQRGCGVSYHVTYPMIHMILPPPPAPPPRQTNTCKNIAFPQTSVVGGEHSAVKTNVTFR